MQIIEEYLQKDGRIKAVFHKENKGTLITRNDGIKVCAGEYVMFVDGDDYYSIDACEKAYNAIVTENTDILQFGVDMFSDEGELDRKTVSSQKTGNFAIIKRNVHTDDENGLLNREKVNFEINPVIYNKIYKKDVLLKMVGNTPDERIVVSEDRLQSFITAFFAHSFSSIDEYLYNYRIGGGVSTKNYLGYPGIEATAKMVFVFKYLENWLKENSDIAVTGWLLEKYRREVTNYIWECFAKRCKDEDREYFVNCLMEYASPQEILTPLLVTTYELKTNSDYYKNQCNMLDKALKEIQYSTSYKIGNKIVRVLGKIKSFMKK